MSPSLDQRRFDATGEVTAGRTPIHNHRRGFFVHSALNFIQILFATERMLEFDRGTGSKRPGPQFSYLTGTRVRAIAPKPPSERKSACKCVQCYKASRPVCYRDAFAAFSQQWSSASVGADGHWEVLRNKWRRSAGNAIVATSPKPASTNFYPPRLSPDCTSGRGKPSKIEGSPPMGGRGLELMGDPDANSIRTGPYKLPEATPWLMERT